MFHFGRGLNLGREFIKAALQVRDLSIVDDAAEELALGNTEGFGGSFQEVVILFREEAHGGAHGGWAVVGHGGHGGAVWGQMQSRSGIWCKKKGRESSTQPRAKMFHVKHKTPQTPTNSRPIRRTFVCCCVSLTIPHNYKYHNLYPNHQHSLRCLNSLDFLL